MDGNFFMLCSGRWPLWTHSRWGVLSCGLFRRKAPNPVSDRVTNLLPWEALDLWITPPDRFFSVSPYGRPEIIDNAGNVQPAKDDPLIANKITYWESNGQITRQVEIPGG